jgi:hypothetical protein
MHDISLLIRHEECAAKVQSMNICSPLSHVVLGWNIEIDAMLSFDGIIQKLLLDMVV